MQRWFASLAIAGAFGGAVSAQVIQVQVQGRGQAQVQQIQIQAQPVQIQPGRVIAQPVVTQARMMQADAIFAGRVVAMEPMDVEVESAKGQPKVTYRIATVQVTEAIHGLKKDTKMVRVAFVAQPNNGQPGGIGGAGGAGGNIQILPAIQPGAPGGGLRRPFPGNANMQLTVGQDGLFSVNKHFKENFYLSPNYQNFVNRENNPNFENDVKSAKSLAKVMGDPVANLKAEDKQDRYLAAAVLITKYRSNTLGQPMKTEKIDAAESKLILQALAGGDWTPGRFNAAIPNPFELFNQLGITVKDGYELKNVRNQQDIAQAMQKWLDDNNGKYVIQKLVPDPNAKTGNAGGGTGQPGIEPGIRPGVRPLPPIRVQPPKQDK
jgi:hypothetical protein